MNNIKDKKVLILGGYGNFGRRISTTLANYNIPIIIAGRNNQKATLLASQLKQQYPHTSIETAIFDIDKDLAQQLTTLQPHIVINTCGPFQKKDYSVAELCISHHAHYIDLSDARDFVINITELDNQAKQNNVAVISGASTVPGLSSAVLQHFKSEFNQIDSVKYGITPGQQADRGLATTEAILTYLGKPLKPAFGSTKKRYGWQSIYKQRYPELGKRWMANCDIPDLDLLPQYFKIKNIHFSAGMESGLLHLGMWLSSWLVRLKLPLNLSKHARFLLKISHWFDWLGSPDGGMHMIIKGQDKNNQPKTIKWFIIAKSGDGPQIPIIPTIVLTKKLLNNPEKLIGAKACVGLVTLDEYLSELSELDIETYTKRIEALKSEGELFKKILGPKWQTLHPDIRKRFEKNPKPGHPLKYQGNLEELSCSFAGKILARLAKPFINGALMPYCDSNFPVDIEVYSKENCPYIFKQRIYKLHHKKPIQFTSFMKESNKGDVLEYVGAGLGMKLLVFVKDGNLHFKSDGYFWDIGFCKIPIPGLFTPGKTYLTHVNEGANKFRIRIDIDHIIFGKMFIQAGVFQAKY
jgi:hypothetical protein